MELFLEFVDRKQRESRRHLKLVEAMLKKAGLTVQPNLDDDNPFVFVKATNNKLSFDGIRIYEIGNVMAYRIQREPKTEPYGKAYMLNLEEMFNDFMSESMEEQEAGQKVIESVVMEVKKFFDKSAKAEQELKSAEIEGGGLIVRAGGTDYSATVLSKS